MLVQISVKLDLRWRILQILEEEKKYSWVSRSCGLEREDIKHSRAVMEKGYEMLGRFVYSGPK